MSDDKTYIDIAESLGGQRRRGSSRELGSSSDEKAEDKLPFKCFERKFDSNRVPIFIAQQHLYSCTSIMAVFRKCVGILS